jgi:hypothetical protein
MSDTHQATGSEQSSTTGTSTGSTPSQTGGQANGGAAPPAPFWEGFTDKTLAAERSVTRYQTPEEMARGYVNLEKRFGIPEDRRIDLPEDMASDEAMRPVWSKLGLPDKPEGYNLKLGDGANEADNALLGKYVEQAHKAGLPTPQARAMLEWWVQMNADQQKASGEALAQRKTDGEAALKTAFGTAYDDRMREAKNLLGRYDPEGKTGLTADTLTTFPAWTQMLIRMSDRMQEPGGMEHGETEQADRPLTPGQATAKLNEFNLDEAKQEALFNPGHPAHKGVVAERNKLLEAAHPRPGAAR